MDVAFSRVRVFDGHGFLDGLHDVRVTRSVIADIRPAGGGDAHPILAAGGGDAHPTRPAGGGDAHPRQPAGGGDAHPRQPGHRGGVLFPGFVDAHVHLSFSDARGVARGGVTSVVDLGAPTAYAFAEHPPVRVHAAGPIITAWGGYPTRSWGAGGYGLEVDASSARDAVAAMADAGAMIIKAALEPAEPSVLSPDVLGAVVGAAHARGLKVAAHALDVASVRQALRAGVDVLAHTPLERLPDDVVAEVRQRGVVVISTLRAFGAKRDACTNLAALAATDCVIAYGTDLGNGSIAPGIDVRELALLSDALGDPLGALRCATSIAGGLCGGRGVIAEGRGVIAEGRDADLVWLERYEGVEDLAGAKRIWIGGKEIT